MTTGKRTPIRLYMSTSVDGFIAGPDDERGQKMGRGGFRLFDWLDDRNGPGINGEVYAEAAATGAVISGRRTFELAGRWGGDHHDGVAINVLTHGSADGEALSDNTRFYDDVAACAVDARAAAGGRAVMVHGAGAAQALLRAGELDEIELHLVPVLLGAGRRLFDDIADLTIELEPVRQLQGRGVTHLRYRVSPGS